MTSYSTHASLTDGRPTNAATFWGIYRRAFVHPRRSLERLVSNPEGLAMGAKALLLTAALYTLMYACLTLGGAAPSSFAPWLAIPKEVYYRYNTLLLAPSMFVCWLSAASIGHLLARAWGGQGNFEQTAAAIGVSISLASWTTLVHDLTGSILGALHMIDARAHEAAMNAPTIWRGLILTLFVLYAAAFLYTFATSIAVSQRLGRAKSLTLGTLAFCVYQGMFFVFNR